MIDLDNRKYGTAGYNVLRDEVRLAWDDGDKFASTMAWSFALAHLLHHGEVCPAGWEYVHGAGGCEINFEEEMIIYHLINGSVSAEDMINLGNILARYRVWLGLAGKDY